MYICDINLKEDFMANCRDLFNGFNDELNILSSKKVTMMTSRENLRKKIKNHFAENHEGYAPSFYIQGSYKLGTCIRTKDDHCDMDDGVYFKSNPDEVSGNTLQEWVMNAVDGTTDASPVHKNKCIRVNYQAGYNIDLPVLVFDKEVDEHPQLAVRDDGFCDDDPKEFVEYCTSHDVGKNNLHNQKHRMVRYLKAWCDNVRDSMPSGVSMTVMTMNHYMYNERDDVALKFLLVAMESALKLSFACYMPTTPCDDLFANYSESRKQKILDRLHSFVEDAKEAVNEPNQLKASKLWRKHLGDRFPLGEDKSEDAAAKASALRSVIGSSTPFWK